MTVPACLSISAGRGPEVELGLTRLLVHPVWSMSQTTRIAKTTRTGTFGLTSNQTVERCSMRSESSLPGFACRCTV